jgi:molybdenum cofactor biosynthesis enzyme MoaA
MENISNISEDSSFQSSNCLMVNPGNFKKLKELSPTHYDWIRLDSNNLCNLRCSYCGPTISGIRGDNGRLSLSDMATFFKEKVISLNSFQLGCTQEPTFDDRFEDFLIAGRVIANPKNWYRVQTNALLLDNFNLAVFKEAGVTTLTVSIDSISPLTNSKLRSGANIGKIIANTAMVKSAHPDINLAFICVVTTLNIAELEDLVKFAIGFGASFIEFREVVLPYEGVYRNEKIKELRLAPGQFEELEKVLSKFKNKIKLHFNPVDCLLRYQDQFL